MFHHSWYLYVSWQLWTVISNNGCMQICTVEIHQWKPTIADVLRLVYHLREEVKPKLYFRNQLRPLYNEKQNMLSKLRFYYTLDMFNWSWRGYVKSRILVYLVSFTIINFICFFSLDLIYFDLNVTFHSFLKKKVTITLKQEF